MSLKLGWIGCGRHASQMLLPQLGRNDIRIAAVCDVNAQNANAVAAQYGLGAIYSDYRELIAHPGLDAIGMAVGPEIHYLASLAALARGLPVFLEKPPAATAAQTEELAAESDRIGKPLIVGFMKRYSTGNRIAKNILTGSEFGQVLGIAGNYMTAPSYFVGEPDFTGFFLHHCVHYMDLLPWFAGSEFADLKLRKIAPSPGKLLFHLNFACENGVIGNVAMGTVQSRGTPTEFIQIMGDHGRVEVSNIINVSYFRDPPFKADDPDATLEGAVDTLIWTPNFTAAANEDHKGYNALIADAARALKGESSTAPDIHDGLRAMRRLEAMIALVEQGK